MAALTFNVTAAGTTASQQLTSSVSNIYLFGDMANGTLALEASPTNSNFALVAEVETRRVRPNAAYRVTIPSGWYVRCNMISPTTTPNLTVVVDGAGGGAGGGDASAANQLTQITELQAIRYATEEAVAGISVPQTTFSMAAVNDAITVSVDAGVDLSIATAIPNFLTGGTFAVAFEQFNGTTWSAMTVYPKTLIAGSGPVTSDTAVGMYRVRVPLGITQVRVRLSAVSGIAAVWAWIERYTDGAKVHLPFLGFTGGGTFGLATNNPIVPPIQWDRLGDVSVDFQTFTGTSQTAVWQATNDDAGVNWSGVAHKLDTSATPLAGTSTTSAGVYNIVPSRQYFRVNLTYTALTAMAINSVVATVTSSATIPAIVVAGGSVAAGTTTGIGNPFPSGFQCQTAVLTTADGNNRLGIPVLTPARQVVVRNGQLRAGQSQNSITLTTTTETTLLSAVASLFQDVTTLIIANTSATGVRVDFRSTTGGAVVLSVWVPPTSTFSPEGLGTGILQAAVNTNWTAQLSAAVTDVRIFAKADRFVG